VNLTAHLRVGPRLRIHGTIPPLFHMSSWRGAHLRKAQGQLIYP